MLTTILSHMEINQTKHNDKVLTFHAIVLLVLTVKDSRQSRGLRKFNFTLGS